MHTVFSGHCLRAIPVRQCFMPFDNAQGTQQVDRSGHIFGGMTVFQGKPAFLSGQLRGCMSRRQPMDKGNGLPASV